jgi:SET domain-containing protein
LTPKAEVRLVGSRRGHGSFAIEPISAGEVVAAFGGWVVDRQQLVRASADRQARSIQIEDDLYLMSGDEPEPGDMVNHSCDPTCGLAGQIVVVALRDVRVGEELTFDYAMCDGYPEVLFRCECGSQRCRGEVTGDDWRRPDLQQRYRRHFSPYLERRMS